MSSDSEILSLPDAPSKVTSLQSAPEDSIELTTRAYSKIILHAAKYPYASVNGVVLAKSPPKGQKAGAAAKLSLIDTIPLFHQSEGLSPMVEVALTQIESRAASVGMVIAGFYHANRSFHLPSSIDVFSQRIADRVADLCPLGRAALLTVDNRRLGLNMEQHALLGQMFIGNAEGGPGGGRWRTIANKSIRVDDMAFAITSSLLHGRKYKDLSDFDNHLDDVSQDYLNVDLMIDIDAAAGSPLS